MNSLLVAFLTTFLLFELVHGGQFVPLDDVKIDKLPGQPVEINVKQFSGYIDVDKDSGRSFFYYLVQPAKQPSNDLPLTIWLTGGPGCSSVGDGFSSVGPFVTSANARGLQPNPYSWIDVSNLLFIDSPTGSGWSYSNTSSDYKNGDYRTNKDLVTFMLKWYKKFPCFKSRDIILAGSSYAGHFVPNLANSLLDCKDFKFNVKGLTLGNPLLRRKLDELATSEFLLSRKMIDSEIHNKIMQECNTIDEDNYGAKVAVNWTKNCSQLMDKALSAAFNITDPRMAQGRLFDVLRKPCKGTLEDLKLGKEVAKISHGVDMCVNLRTDFYFNLPEVQKAFHGNRTNLPYPWKGCIMSNFAYTKTDIDFDMLPALKRLLQKSIPITIFSGLEDGMVPAVGTQKHLKKLAEELGLKFTKKESLNGGCSRYSYGDFLNLFTVKGGSHHVTASRPSQALYIFKNFVLKIGNA
ncbi:Peptidase S10, serine carboxypeptidase [Corchorus capsularis]|uniref:Peptidase S10, serine carboxypeptidase n=1 Tax=Corchorus capsularis TaxID=210143 RepID=A0A1R3G3E8_COCAP|nr:Peptidase S10, serine carboxypeptidase [Corchorus capsularis]